MESETIAPKQAQYNKNRRSPECQKQMVRIGLSKIKQKIRMSENAGECQRRSEKVGVSWMFKWYMTSGGGGGGGSDDHRPPLGKFLPTCTCTCQNPYPYIQVQVPFLQVWVHTGSCGFVNPYRFLLWVTTLNLYIYNEWNVAWE